MSSDESGCNNRCLVCLESLSLEPVGAVVPCGHCLHVSCWNGWTASRLAGASTAGRSVKCPMCNSSSTNFVRLFCDFGAQTLDDDEWSLSSNEEGENDANNTLGPFNETVVSSSGQSHDHLENSNHDVSEVIVLDDDDDLSPAKVSTATAKMKTSIAVDGNDKKYKRKAKQMKERLSQLQADLKQHGIEKEKLIAQVKEQKDALDELESEVNEVAEVREFALREVEGLQLQVTQLKRQNTEIIEKISAVQLEATQCKREMQDMAARFKHRLAQVSAASVKEVQQLLHEHPRIKAENQELKQELQKFQRRLTSLQCIVAEKHGQSSAAAVRTEPSNIHPSKQKRLTKDMLHSISQIHKAFDARGGQFKRTEAVATKALDLQRKKEARNATGSFDTSKLSLHAVRMCRPMKPCRKSTSEASMFHADPPKLPDTLAPSKKKRAPNQGLAEAARRKQKKYLL